ncbi:MAG: murein biosynthesis integral membrane protein MurJ, partial [Candidatus Omnitrophica bacterium]|nr:murein biosynthesis integral membrane protein MurJ [Candidatus Omnitrophota bacterium]
MSTDKSIIRSTGIIGGFTFLSRLLGFFRDILIAHLFGTGSSIEAFVVAFRIPNLIRELLGEGAANASFVPVFSEYLLKDRKQLFKLVNITFNILLLFLSLVAILGIASSGWIVRLIAPGFIKDAHKLNLTIFLTQLMFPYLIFIGLVAYGMGILNTFREFALPAFGPALLNVSLIFFAFFSRYFFSSEPVISLAVGVLVGGFLQLIVQVPSIYRKGFRFRFPDFNFRDPGISKIYHLLIPRIFGSAIYHLNVFFDTICASFSQIVGYGAVAAIYYANRLIQFPLAIFGIALSTATLPVMAQEVVSDNIAKLKETVSFSLCLIFLIMLPFSLFLFLLAEPLVRVLFQRGNFNSLSTAITSWALIFYSFGLTSYSGTKLISSVFYALQDTKTPVKVAGLCLISNLILNILLMWPLQVGGLALASSISSSLNFFLLFYILEKRIGRLDRFKIKNSFLKVMLATFIASLTIEFLK